MTGHKASFLLTLIGFLCCISGCSGQPYHDSVTAEALEDAAQSCGSILAQVEESSEEGALSYSYYEFSGCTEFAELLAVSDWSVTGTEPQGGARMTLRFAEAWLLELYPDGCAWAHNGYAASGTKGDCYYTYSTDVLDAVIAYLEEHASARTLGDGAISVGTFHH